ncbi:GPI-anchored cell wall beta-1,3-endoglucanase [Cordyceps militaris]|uniref:Probable glucan endo-1,3-beta-glucosidase eglC n=1 Tax=Cordyceps militaris TaxID=73501 RepID=A0A2H4SPT0_CORMI|nr:GPI-anchored cell wall beta-1,3-endoglucanase [Cordyceps militaris]
MPSSSSILALATAITGATAAFTGFNYESKGKDQAGFEAEFKNAQGLDGTNGIFNSARLYTMIQDGTVSDPITAIPAAISTKTSLLFGLWASAGQAQFDNEISALKKTAQQYCDKLDGLVAGISVGSEDLYRDSPIGQAAGENPGAGPSVLANYVQQTRDAIKGTCLEKAPIGHVDTWTAYANSTNRALSDKLDWVGMDAYPYYENQKDNGIENAEKLFQAAIDNTNTGTGGKPLWITETGWPVSGKSENKAQASVDNAKTFWRDVGCPRFGKVNTFWFIMQDGGPSQSDKPSFGIVGGSTLSTKPLFDLSCDGYTNGGSGSGSSSSSSSSSQQSSTSASGSQSDTTATATATSQQSSGASTVSDASSTLSTSAAGSGSSSSSGSVPVPVGTGGLVPSHVQPSGTGTGAGTGVVPSRTPTSPSGSSTPTPIGSNAAAGLNSVAAAVAAIFVAVAAF